MLKPEGLPPSKSFVEKSNAMQPKRFKVLLTEEAKLAYQAISSRADIKAVNGILDVLDTVPGIGRTYNPIYEAARPSFDVWVAYAGNYSIYYGVKEKADEVYVYFIEDQRRDPLKRFGRSVGR